MLQTRQPDQKKRVEEKLFLECEENEMKNLIGLMSFSPQNFWNLPPSKEIPPSFSLKWSVFFVYANTFFTTLNLVLAKILLVHIPQIRNEMAKVLWWKIKLPQLCANFCRFGWPAARNNNFVSNKSLKIHCSFRWFLKWRKLKWLVMENTIVQAEFTFKGSNNDELCFKKGDLIVLTNRDDGGWWEKNLIFW